MKTKPFIRSAGLVASFSVLTLPAQAVAPNALPSAPLYLAGGVAPNLIVTLDDSGSMSWGYVPDNMGSNARRTCSVTGASSELSGTETKRYFLSGDYNAQYYNPSITYLPPLKQDGTPYSTSFSAALINGFVTSSGAPVVNLDSAYQPTYGYMPKSSPTHCYAYHPKIDIDAGTFSSGTAGVRAYYYRYQTGGAGCTGASISKTNEACYVYTVVGASEEQNFANWYSFYRTRNLATVTAATRAFNNLPSTMRLAWQALNNSCDDFTGSGCSGWDGAQKDNRIRKLSATNHKQNFYDWLVRLPASGGTPLRAALGRAGEYYSTAASTTNKNSPYAEDPQVTVGTTHSCRANYTIMMTDGIWNGSSASGVSGNVDNTSIPLPDGTGYSPRAPFADGNSDSLADVAFYYWANDLRKDLTNNVPRDPRALDKLIEDNKTIPTADYFDAKNDPASWQHMVTYTVGLGLTTTFPTLTPALAWAGDTYKGSYSGLAAGTLAWPAIGNDNPGNVADLWHTALNGRGLFFSAEDPKSLSDAMQEVVNNIISRSASAAAIATNSKRLDTNTVIYQASFDSGSWTGELEAFDVDSNGGLAASLWKASTVIPASRNIKSFDGAAGIDFAWGSLSSAQQAALGSQDVLNYLRGDQSKEQSKGGGFRNRASILGDIVNSDPLFVGEDNFGFNTLSGTEGADYVTFLQAKKNNTTVVYVGANDGMLHAFRSSDGVELFAYVPGLVYANLANLTKPNYSHTYYVDGSPALGDVYYGGATWKSVLVSTLGAGGRGVFALDVSSPNSAFATSNVLWEFDGKSSTASPKPSTVNDMGYTVGNATVGRFQDGKYYAVFGNGYGSANCRSALFMVQVDAPSNVKFFDTGEGDCNAATNQNGMSTPSLVDYDGDRVIDAIYAGDLLGKVWKWDVSSTTSSVWDFATGGKPMFSAVGPDNNKQPITAQLEVGRVPAAATGKAMIYFGTGRYLYSGDESDKSIQSFYALLDEGKPISKLNKQVIVYEDAKARVVGDGVDKKVSWTSEQGWYLNLLPPSGTKEGERVLSVPLLRYGRVIFNTAIPSPDPCVFGGPGWLMELDAATGSNLDYGALDINGDGKLDTSDYVTYSTGGGGGSTTSPAAGKRFGSMSLNQPTVIPAGEKEYKFNSDIKKGISVTIEKGGSANPRSSWRQIQ